MKRIHYILAISALVAVFVYGCSLARAAECLSSARAVWSAHPGSWATWRIINGSKCWFARAGAKHLPASSTKSFASHDSAVRSRTTGSIPVTGAISSTVPLPRPVEREARWNYPEWVYVFGMWTEIMEGNQ